MCHVSSGIAVCLSLPTLELTCGERTLLIYAGSSRGRGTRAAGWFADRIEEQGESGLKSLVLEGGIKGWVGAGPEYTEWMDGYEEAVWRA